MVHDLAESIVGDITPHCNVSKEEKRQLEEVQPQNNSVA
jgi:5'-deoxynucleotidase YfbR-like HD superfamily hydrolase